MWASMDEMCKRYRLMTKDRRIKQNTVRGVGWGCGRESKDSSVRYKDIRNSKYVNKDQMRAHYWSTPGSTSRRSYRLVRCCDIYLKKLPVRKCPT